MKKTIKVYVDKLLPSPTLHKVQIPVSILHEEALVRDLLTKDEHEWNKNLIENIFWEE